jgi:DNA-binding response OmpR family regulator
MMGSRPKVLIVDDCYVIREIISATLCHKYDCAMTSNVGDALMLMQSESFDLVLLDIELPDCSGFAVNLYVRRTRPETAVVFISATADEAVRQLVSESGARGFLSKPFTPDQLAAEVDRALADKNTDDT